MDRMRLDVRLHSTGGGAVRVEVPKAPDVHLDLDFQVRGTVAKPQITGRTQGADLYSRLLLWLAGAPR
jgi:hypothetical protein